MHKLSNQAFFALKRPIFSARARSEYPCLQFYLNQDCHNIWAGCHGREYMIGVHRKALHKKPFEGDLPAPKGGLKQRSSLIGAINDFTVYVGM